jgi:ATP-dependent DNA helicase RecQ
MPDKPSRRRAPRRTSNLSSAKSEEALAVAMKYLGFEQFRPGQEHAIRSLLGKRDTLVVMPTGSGKSAIYQVAGTILQGVVLVVSPLIALQKDQVDSINARHGKAEAVVINSTLKASEFHEILGRVLSQACKFVFLAPEQLQKEETLQALKKAKISMVAIDEAHCISQWGHDFRPDYLQLGKTIEALKHPTTLAMTATASELVRQEIIERLGMKKPQIFVGGFDRPNIHLRVDHFQEEDKKLEALIHQVRWADKPGIIYVAARKSAEQIMSSLEEEGVKSLFYHGGMKGTERADIQNRFMSGEAEVIVATNAFGMGIDKPDIRFVYHHDVPDSLDSYYQEIGRAGRDGKRAEARLFFREQDIGAQSFRTGRGKSDLNQLEQLAEAIAEEEQPVSAQEIADNTDLSTRKVSSAIQKLEDAGVVQILPSGDVQLADDADLEQAAQVALDQQEERQEANRERLAQMRAYANSVTCRREHLLRYFGETFTGPCYNCDNCEADRPEINIDPTVGTRREVA